MMLTGIYHTAVRSVPWELPQQFILEDAENQFRRLNIRGPSFQFFLVYVQLRDKAVSVQNDVRKDKWQVVKRKGHITSIFVFEKDGVVTCECTFGPKQLNQCIIVGIVYLQLSIY